MVFGYLRIGLADAGNAAQGNFGRSDHVGFAGVGAGDALNFYGIDRGFDSGGQAWRGRFAGPLEAGAAVAGDDPTRRTSGSTAAIRPGRPGCPDSRNRCAPSAPAAGRKPDPVSRLLPDKTTDRRGSWVLSVSQGGRLPLGHLTEVVQVEKKCVRKRGLTALSGDRVVSPRGRRLDGYENRLTVWSATRVSSSRMVCLVAGWRSSGMSSANGSSTNLRSSMRG